MCLINVVTAVEDAIHNYLLLSFAYGWRFELAKHISYACSTEDGDVILERMRYYVDNEQMTTCQLSSRSHVLKRLSFRSMISNVLKQPL